MRKNRSMRVTSQCLLLMAVLFEPHYLTRRSLEASVAAIRGFRLRNRQSVRVIIHRGTKKRTELQILHVCHTIHIFVLNVNFDLILG
ncbi:hypothetical protein L916_04332, partial [Phytophthora nicotianae]